MSLKRRPHKTQTVEDAIQSQLEAPSANVDVSWQDQLHRAAPVEPKSSTFQRFKGWVDSRRESYRLNRAYKSIGKTAVMIAEANFNRK